MVEFKVAAEYPGGSVKQVTEDMGLEHQEKIGARYVDMGVSHIYRNEK